jgi:hypothetical protein
MCTAPSPLPSQPFRHAPRSDISSAWTFGSCTNGWIAPTRSLAHLRKSPGSRLSALTPPREGCRGSGSRDFAPFPYTAVFCSAIGKSCGNRVGTPVPDDPPFPLLRNRPRYFFVLVGTDPRTVGTPCEGCRGGGQGLGPLTGLGRLPDHHAESRCGETQVRWSAALPGARHIGSPLPVPNE